MQFLSVHTVRLPQHFCTPSYDIVFSSEGPEAEILLAGKSVSEE